MIKWFGWRHPLHLYLSPTVQGRAAASWEVARALTRAGARTPRPLYVYTRRRRGFIIENYFITECVHPHQTLRALFISDAPTRLMTNAVVDLAQSIARMHQTGIQHRDLTTGNFLVDDSGKVFIVDLNRARLRPRITRQQRLSDLARLNFTARDPELEARLSHEFFQVYQSMADSAVNWEREYRDYRRRLLIRRDRKKRLSGIIGRK